MMSSSSTTCSYCGNPKEDHDQSRITETRRHVKVSSGSITALKGTYTTVGDCIKKARKDDNIKF
jgi:hypothetical protein